MRLLVLNPNRNHLMTQAVCVAVAALLPGTVQVLGWTAENGPAVIKDKPSFAQAEAAMPDLLAATPPADGILLACFGDPGLPYLRAHACVPVAGLAEAALAHERQQGEPFAIITAGVQWVPILRQYAEQAGTTDLLADVLALPGNGATLQANPSRFRGAVMRASLRAKAQGARRIILGGAAFEGLSFTVASGLRVDRPVALATARLACDMGIHRPN